MERAQTVGALDRVGHKQEELVEASDGSYDPRTSALSARQDDIKIELQNIESRLEAYSILIQLTMSCLTDALQKGLHTPSKHAFDSWSTGSVSQLRIASELISRESLECWEMAPGAGSSHL